MRTLQACESSEGKILPVGDEMLGIINATLPRLLRVPFLLWSFLAISLSACGDLDGIIESTAPPKIIPFSAKGAEIVSSSELKQMSVLNGYIVDSSAGQISKSPLIRTSGGYSVYVGVGGQILSEEFQ